MPNTKARILVVDDDPLIRTSMSQIFKGLGYFVRTAEDGFTALVEIESEIPDIVVSDLYMPGMSGFELLSVIRCQYPTIPVIAMSSAFSDVGVPPTVAADGFYEKSTGLGSLLRLMKIMQTASRGRRAGETSGPLRAAGERHYSAV